MAASAGSSDLNGNDSVVFYRAWINCGAAISPGSVDDILGMSKL